MKHYKSQPGVDVISAAYLEVLMANPRSFLDKVTPVAAMRTGCAEGGEWSVAAGRGWVVEIENRVIFFFAFQS